MDMMPQSCGDASLPDMPAFETWLKRGLRERYGDTLLEAVPDELTALILN